MRHGWWLALGFLLTMSCQATQPAPLPRCPVGFYNRQPVPHLIQLIAAYADDSRDSDWKATCAAEELARRGEEVVPALIRLMDTHRDPVIDLFAMEALCGKGHSGSSAINYLLKRLPTDKTAFTIEAHRALSCMGPHAKRAIPYLIQTSGDDFRAVQTLGELAKYYPTLIVPHLTQLLDNSARTGDAARALEHAGAPARPALDALSSHLAIAVTEHRNDIASALAKAIGSVGDPRITVPLLLPLLDSPGPREAAAEALGRIGPPAAAAVPRLIGRLDDPEIDWRERSTAITALASIDMGSLQVRSVLLHETVSDKNGLGNMAAAIALAKAKGLPADFAPQLMAVMESLPERDSIREELALALEHTHTGKHTVGSPEQPPPVSIDNTLIDGLWALLQQPQPLTLKDVIQLLGLKREDYNLEGTPSDYTLDARWAVYHNRPDSVPIAHVTFFGAPPRHLAGVPILQEVRVTFSNRFCLAAQSVAARVSRPIGSGYSGQPVFTLKGTPHDKRLAWEGALSVGAQCSGGVRISKSFDPDLVIDPAVIGGAAK